jgi:5-methylcytosine-specific restriction endonuclease McrA
MASQIGLSIQRDLARRNKKYFAMNHKLMWKQIKAYVGYTKDELLDHIESQFKPWMTWTNNGRPQDAENPTWQLDHIKPKSSFNYISIADPEFAKCWALENLQPLESRLNLLKSNKNLRSRLRSSFNNGIKSKKILRSGIWAHLPYTNLEAKKYFENLFADDMTWDNWGEKWHIDHVIPQAYLSYTDVKEKNFRYCWDLENLRPVARSKNCAKSSRHENKLWFYNEI